MTRRSLEAFIVATFLVCCGGLAMLGCGEATEGDVGRAAQIAALRVSADTVSRASWQAAPAGCDGLIDDESLFDQAEGAPELVVARARDGRVLCVDTVPALEEALAALAQPPSDPAPDQSDSSRTREDAKVSPETGGNPHPQPSQPSPYDGTRQPTQSQPEPEQNHGNPHPQPSRPWEEAAARLAERLGASGSAGTPSGGDW